MFYPWKYWSIELWTLIVWKCLSIRVHKMEHSHRYCKWFISLLFLFDLKPNIVCCKKINYHCFNLINNWWFVFSFTVLPQVQFLIWCNGITLLKFDNITQMKLILEMIMTCPRWFFHDLKFIHNLCYFYAWRIYDYQEVSDLLILSEFIKDQDMLTDKSKEPIFTNVFAGLIPESSYRNSGLDLFQPKMPPSLSFSGM